MNGIQKKYRGVTAARGHWHDGTWQAQIRAGRKVVTWPGRFADVEDAARIYDVMAIYLHGPDAKLNFDGHAPAGITRADVKQFLLRRGVLPGRYWNDEPERFARTPLI